MIITPIKHCLQEKMLGDKSKANTDCVGWKPHSTESLIITPASVPSPQSPPHLLLANIQPTFPLTTSHQPCPWLAASLNPQPGESREASVGSLQSSVFSLSDQPGGRSLCLSTTGFLFQITVISQLASAGTLSPLILTPISSILYTAAACLVFYYVSQRPETALTVKKEVYLALRSGGSGE